MVWNYARLLLASDAGGTPEHEKALEETNPLKPFCSIPAYLRGVTSWRRTPLLYLCAALPLCRYNDPFWGL